VVDLTGPDRAGFLQGQLTQDVETMAAGEVRPAAGLTPKGKLIYVARLLALSDRFRLILPAALRSPVLEHLRKYSVFQKVAVEDRSADFHRFGIYGQPGGGLPQSAQWIALPPEGEFSGELLVPAAESAPAEAAFRRAGLPPIEPEAAEVLRVEAGRARFGQDFDGTNLPDEVGLADAISTTKGCYVGQEVVARLRTYGRVNRRLVGFQFPDGLVASGTVLRNPEETEPGRIEWGRVTSAVTSPRYGPIGLGFAFREIPLGGRLVSSADPSRGALAAALPFR
jgi:tRNA-modifying protein YgfZ